MGKTKIPQLLIYAAIISSFSVSSVECRKFTEGDVSSYYTFSNNRIFLPLLQKFENEFLTGFPVDHIVCERPFVDISETENKYTITAELPGLNEKDVEIELENKTLIIKGEKKIVREKKVIEYHRIERASGKFKRIIPIPFEFSDDLVIAKFKDGLLTIDIIKPKKPKIRAKKIEIQKG
jgi:HSP20 family protein